MDTELFNDEDMVIDWDYPDYIVRSELIKRWCNHSDLIDEFLPIPDAIDANPHNSNQRMRLYLKHRVFKLERSKAFIEALGNKIQDLKSNINSFCKKANKLCPELIQIQQIKHNKNQFFKRQRIQNKFVKQTLEALGLTGN